MKANKRIVELVSVTLVLILLMHPFTLHASALEKLDQDAEVHLLIQSEIEREKERIFSSVYEQLLAQDAVGLMDIYEQILIPKIQANVYAKYGMAMPAEIAASSYTYTLRNGGQIGYNGFGNSTVLCVYLLPYEFRTGVGADLEDQTETCEMFLDEIYDMLNDSDVNETVKGWGAVFAILLCMRVIANISAIRDVQDAGGYAEIINVSAAGGTEQGSTVIGWDNYPTAVIPTLGTSGIHVSYN